MSSAPPTDEPASSTPPDAVSLSGPLYFGPLELQTLHREMTQQLMAPCYVRQRARLGTFPLSNPSSSPPLPSLLPEITRLKEIAYFSANSSNTKPIMDQVAVVISATKAMKSLHHQLRDRSGGLAIFDEVVARECRILLTRAELLECGVEVEEGEMGFPETVREQLFIEWEKIDISRNRLVVILERYKRQLKEETTLSEVEMRIAKLEEKLAESEKS